MIIYKNIIFDLGGVLFDIDYKRTEHAFKDLGMTDFNSLYSQLKQDRLFDDFETGHISATDFRSRIRSLAPRSLSNSEIDHAWNAILIGLPPASVELLQNLKDQYRLFLLSNTNEIHEAAFKEMIRHRYGSYILDECFEKIYLSHHMHMRKPNVEIFQKVISDNELNPIETIFIDDTRQHVEGAVKAGLQAFRLEKGTSTAELINRIISGKL